MRLMLLTGLLLTAQAISAQASEPISGSVPGGRRITYLYSIDFGPNATNFSVGCSLTTPSTGGLALRLIDVDSLAGSGALSPTAVDEHVIPGVGTALCSLSGNYSGVREFIVEVESAGAGSSFNGDLTTSAGTITFIESDQLLLTASSLRVTVQRRAFWAGSVSGTGVAASSMQLDLGPVSRTVFFRFEAAASGVQQVQLINTTGGNSVVMLTLDGGSLPDAKAVPLTASGLVTIRVNVRGAGGLGSGAWSVTAPSGINVSYVDATGGQERDDDDGCMAGPASGPAWALGAFALLLLRRRKC